MDEKLKIKLSIADRVYPLTVDMSQEEGLRSASKKIDLMIKQFEESYAVRDKQDVLAMCALQFASQLEQKQLDNSIDGKETIERIGKINDSRPTKDGVVKPRGPFDVADRETDVGETKGCHAAHLLILPKRTARRRGALPHFTLQSLQLRHRP